MNFQNIPTIPIINTTTYSKMATLKDFTIHDHVALVENLKADGYEEVFRMGELGVSTGVYKKDNELITLLRTPESREMKILWEDIQYNAIEPLAQPETVGEGETTMSQIGVGAYGEYDDDPMIGIFYLYKNSDGHAVIIDGGLPLKGCAEDIYKGLASHGIAKDEDGKFIIDAWIFTHAHNDHVGAFNAYAEAFADTASVKYIIYNMPSDGKLTYNATDFDVFEKNIDLFGAKRVIPRVGQTYYFGNLKLTILYSPELIYEKGKWVHFYNDVGITFTIEANGVRALFTGDAGDEPAKKMLECMRPSTLKSDFVQLAHHGLVTSHPGIHYGRVERAIMTRGEKDSYDAAKHINENLTKLYKTAAPKVGLWPMGDTNGQPRNGRTTVMRDWSRQYGQTAHFVDTSREDSGYDGVNIVRKGDLITYTQSSETDQMITKFAFKDGNFELLTNELWSEYTK